MTDPFALETRRLLDEDFVRIQECLDRIPRLVILLSSAEDETRKNAAWALAVICAGTAKQTRCVVDAGALPLMIKLIGNDDVLEIRGRAMWALGNIAFEFPVEVIRQGGLVAMIGFMVRFSDIFSCYAIELVTWGICNLCQSSKCPLDMLMVAVPIKYNLSSTNADILINCCNTLSSLIRRREDNSIDEIMTRVDVANMARLLWNDDPRVQRAAIQTLGQISVGSDAQTQLLLDCGVVKASIPLLSADSTRTVKDACWMLSNITAGPLNQIDEVVQSKAITSLVQVIATRPMFCAIEATWAISNATLGSPCHIQRLAECGSVSALSTVAYGAKKPREVLMALKGLVQFCRYMPSALSTPCVTLSVGPLVTSDVEDIRTYADIVLNTAMEQKKQME